MRAPAFRLFAAVSSAVLLGVASAPALAASGGPAGFHPGAAKTEFANLERAIERLTRDYANPIAALRTFSIQRRLIDARVFFELGNYETAAILLLEVVETASFRTSPDYQPTVMLLAKALMEIENVQAARGYLDIVTRGSDAKLVDEARYYLIEMALEREDKAELARLVQRLGAAATDRTRYAVAKGYFHLGQHGSALNAFQGVSAASELHPLARWYVGVVLTEQRRFDQALQEFKSLALLKPKTGSQEKARDLALLGLGRLHAEADRIDQAVNAYQRIGRHSPEYELALYEMAWAHVRREQYDQAMQTVDVLLLVVRDERLNVEGHVLRGRLATLMNNYAEATRSYDRIVERFAPIRNELARFTKDPANIERFFAWLLERSRKGERLTAPLSERTTAWLQSGKEMQRVVAVFDSVNHERKEIKETNELAREVERLISAGNRVELFPALKEGWTRALALENRLLLLSSKMLDAQHDAAKPQLSGADLPELEGMVAWRKKLERRFRKLPMSYAAYESRQSAIDERFLDLRRKAFLVGQSLETVERQLLEIEKFVNNQQYTDRARKKLKPPQEEEIRAAISEEKTRLQSLQGELEGLRKTILVEAARVGTGDKVTKQEGDLKTALISAHKSEAVLYAKVAPQLSGSVSPAFRSYEGLRLQVWSSVTQLKRVIRVIDSRVGEKAATIQRIVDIEKGRLTGYESEAIAQRSDAGRIARAKGEALFEQAARRMDRVVLEADVGLIDVAWERKQEATTKVQRYMDDRSERLAELDRELKQFTGTPSDAEDDEDDEKKDDEDDEEDEE